MAMTAIESLKQAMKTSETSPAIVAQLCREQYGKEKFSELTDDQKWTLVCEIDPIVTGPYGYSMAEFED